MLIGLELQPDRNFISTYHAGSDLSELGFDFTNIFCHHFFNTWLNTKSIASKFFSKEYCIAVVSASLDIW